MADKIAEAYVEISARTTALSRGLTLARSMTTRAMGAMQRAVNAVTAAFMRLAKWAALAATAGMGVFAYGTMRMAMRMEQLKAALVSVTGSAAEATRQLAALQELAKAPGLGFEEAVQAALGLQAAGLSFERTRDLISGMARATARGGGGREAFGAAMEQLKQTASAGKLLGQELRIISMWIPEFRKILQQAFGTAVPEEIAAMGLSIDQIMERIAAAANALPPVAGTTANELENLQDQIKFLQAEIGKDFLPIFKDLLKFGSGLVEIFRQWWETFSTPERQKQLRETMIGVLTNFVLQAATLGAALKWLADMILAVGAWMGRYVNAAFDPAEMHSPWVAKVLKLIRETLGAPTPETEPPAGTGGGGDLAPLRPGGTGAGVSPQPTFLGPLELAKKAAMAGAFQKGPEDKQVDLLTSMLKALGYEGELLKQIRDQLLAAGYA